MRCIYVSLGYVRYWLPPNTMAHARFFSRMIFKSFKNQTRISKFVWSHTNCYELCRWHAMCSRIKKKCPQLLTIARRSWKIGNSCQIRVNSWACKCSFSSHVVMWYKWDPIPKLRFTLKKVLPSGWMTLQLANKFCIIKNVLFCVPLSLGTCNS